MVPAFMECDHLSPTNNTNVLRTSNSTVIRSRHNGSALATPTGIVREFCQVDFYDWYEGQFLAGTVFQ